MLRVRTLAVLFFIIPAGLFAQEICANGVDDDADGLIDLNDPDCPCSPVIMPANTPSFIANHSFEQRVVGPNGPCCPFGFSTPFQNWLSCALNWNQATSATSDYYHMCGFAPSTFPMPPPDGEAAIGFISTTSYMEYVGSCIFDNPLLAGEEYTLSMWTAGLSISATNYAGEPYNMGVFYEGNFPLTLWGRTNCVPMPVGTTGCIGDLPGWVELARVEFQPDNDWLYVSMTFTPAQEIRMVMLGAPCDLPASYETFPGTIETPQGPIPMNYYPYTMVDDLTLTLASDQVLTPVRSSGSICANNVVVTATPPVGATDHQWYLDGVALVGQTGTTLNASALGLSGGVYTLSSVFEGQCLMGSVSVWDPEIPTPRFALQPASGCAPLTVSFTDTTGQGTSTLSWSFGDGATATGSGVVHTYVNEGSYDVTLTIRTADGCVTDTVVTDAVVVAGQATGVISATPSTADVDDPVVLLTGAASVGDIVAWWWDLGSGIPSTSNEVALSVNFPAEPGTYPVMLVVVTQQGCVDTVYSAVVITRTGEIEMPNVFSPNGDGFNDTFRPIEMTGFEGVLEIYNRWGQLLFSTKLLERGWDGTDGGAEVPEGTYYYVVTGSGAEGAVRKGHVTLTR